MMPFAQVTEHGPASLDTTIQCAERHEDELFVLSRNVSPGRLGVFDLQSETVTGEYELPEGRSGFHYSATVLDGVIYFSVSGTTNLYRFVPDDEVLHAVARFPVEGEAAPFAVSSSTAGVVYIGTRHGELYQYDPGTDELDFLREIPGELPAQHLSHHGTQLFVSAGPRAELYAFDDETWEADRISPTELADERIFKFIDSSDDVIVAGSTPNATVAIIDRDEPSNYRLLRPEPEDGKTIQTLQIFDRQVYFHVSVLTDRGRSWPMYRYDLDADELMEIYRLPGWLNVVGLFDGERPLVVPKQSLSHGRGDPIVHFEGVDGGVDVVDLQAGGFHPRSEPPQSLTLAGANPVVGGHAKLTVHDLEAGDRLTVGMLGEAKAPLVVDDTLYIASYPGALIQEFSFDREPPTVVKKIGHDQNRPRDIAYHRERESLFVATHPVEGFLGGALSEYDLSTRTLTVDRPIVEDHSLSTVLPYDDLLIVGTEIPTNPLYRTMDLPESAVLVGWDPEDRAVRWELTPIPGAKTFKSLIEWDGRVYGYSPSGVLFELDPAAPAITRTLPISAETDAVGEHHPADARTVAGESGSLVEHQGDIYGVTTDRVYRVNLDEWSTTDIVTDLDSTWFNWPMVGSTGESLVTLRGTDLIEIEV